MSNQDVHAAADGADGTGTPKSQAAGRVPDLRRRRLLRAGAAATPVLLTVASNPVGATGTVNCTIASSFVSVATFKSRNPGMTVSCAPWNCQTWLSDANSWSPQFPHLHSRRVDACFGAHASCTMNTWTCGNVLKNSGNGIAITGEVAVLQHLIALVNNADSGKLSGLNPSFNKAYLVSVHKNYYDNGRMYRVPGSGEIWDEGRFIGWMRAMLHYAI